MLEKCITLNDILYNNKHYKINRIIFVDDKDVKKLERQGAVRRLVRPKIKRKAYFVDKGVTEIKFSSEKIKKFTKSKRKRKGRE